MKAEQIKEITEKATEQLVAETLGEGQGRRDQDGGVGRIRADAPGPVFPPALMAGAKPLRERRRLCVSVASGRGPRSTLRFDLRR